MTAPGPDIESRPYAHLASPFHRRLCRVRSWDSGDSDRRAVLAAVCASVAVKGESVVRAAYGMADLEDDEPNTPETVFEAGLGVEDGHGDGGDAVGFAFSPGRPICLGRAQADEVSADPRAGGEP